MTHNIWNTTLFLLIQTLPTFWAERILISRIFIFGIAVSSQISRFPGSQISRPRPGPGLGRTWAGRRTVRGTSATPPRHLRTTKLVRSKELGQYRENPISASPVWRISSLRANRLNPKPLTHARHYVLSDLDFVMEFLVTHNRT